MQQRGVAPEPAPLQKIPLAHQAARQVPPEAAADVQGGEVPALRLDDAARWLSAEGLAEALASQPADDPTMERKRSIKHMSQEELLAADGEETGGDCLPQ